MYRYSTSRQPPWEKRIGMFEVTQDVEILSNLLQNALAGFILCDYRSNRPMRTNSLDATGAKEAKAFAQG
jgi:hypothetical protein